MNGSASSSRRLSTPLGVRARLNSLGNNSPRPKKATSSSTLTVQGSRKPHVPLRPTSPSSSEGTDSEDEAAMKEEDADRAAEEQEALDRKLQHLQNIMTNDALGLVSAPNSRPKGKAVERGRAGPLSPGSRSMVDSYRRDTLSSRSTSNSLSSASSPQGSIPDIPSPPGDSQPHSPIRRHLSTSKSSSPPTVSPRSAIGQPHRRYGPLVDRSMSEQESSQGSEASSFSDLSGDVKLCLPSSFSLKVFSFRCQFVGFCIGERLAFEHPWKWLTSVSHSTLYPTLQKSHICFSSQFARSRNIGRPL